MARETLPLDEDSGDETDLPTTAAPLLEDQAPATTSLIDQLTNAAEEQGLTLDEDGAAAAGASALDQALSMIPANTPDADSASDADIGQASEGAALDAIVSADDEQDEDADYDAQQVQLAAAEDAERQEQQERAIDPAVAARVQEVASGINVTPQMIEAFKAENPFFRQFDDATAGGQLQEIIAYGIVQYEHEQAAQGQGTTPEQDAATATEKATDAAAEREYSVWDDIKGLPGAIVAGGIKSGFESYDAVNEMVLGNEANHSEWRRGFESYYSKINGVSGAAATISQFGVAFVGVGKFAKLAKVPGLSTATTSHAGIAAQGAAKGFAADFMAFDGLEGRLSDMVQQYPALQNPITSYLSSSPDDTQAEGRLKNALEGFGIGATVDVVLAGFRAYRGHLKGDKAAVDAAIEEGDAAFKDLNKPAADAQRPASFEERRKAIADQRPTRGEPRPDTQPGTELATPEQIKASDEAGTAGGAGKAGADEAPPQTASTPKFVDEKVAAEAAAYAKRVGFMDPIAQGSILEYDEAFSATGGRGQPTPSTFDSFSSEAEIRALIKGVEDEVLQGISTTHSATGHVSHEETMRKARQFAKDIGEDWNVLVARMAEDGSSLERLEARFVAYGRVTADMAKRVQDLAFMAQKKEPGGFGSMENLMNTLQSNLAVYAQMQDYLKGARAGTGRALAIMRWDESLRRGVKLSLDPNELTKSWDAGGADEVIDAILKAKDHKTLAAVADPTKYAQVRDALVSLYIKNILSGPTTHLVNIIGNTTAALIHPGAKIVGGAIGRDPQIIREGVRQYGFMVTESLNALQMAFESLKSGENFLDPMRSKFTPDGNFPEALSASKLSGGMVPDDSVTGWLANGVFKGIDFVSTRALGASDEFFKQTLYSSELAARAWSEGVDRGLKGDALKTHVKKAIDDGFVLDPTTGRKTAGVGDGAEAALKVARFNTFTGAVKPGGYSSSILSLTNKYPELKFAVPFVRVVSNLLEYTGTMTPLVASRLQVYKDAMARGGRDAAVAKGRLAMGYALWTSAIAMANSGMITGDGPKKSDGSVDYQKLAMLQQSGWKPNSLKIGDTYINLSRLDPIGLPFTLAASVIDKFHDGLEDEQSFVDIATTMMWGLAETMTDRSYLQGLAQFFEAFSDDSGRKWEKWFSNVAGSIVVPNFIRQAGRNNADENLRHARGLVENILNRLPIGSDTLATKRMPWGEKMRLKGSLVTDATDDPVMEEFARLLETGDSGAGQPLPRMKVVPGDKSIDLTRFKLSNGETLYDVYGDLVQQPDPSIPPLKEELARLIASPEYQTEMIDGPGAFKGTRLKAWQTIMARYRAAAWRVILETYPEVRERVYGKKQATAAQRESVDARRRAQVEEFLGE